MLSPRSRRHPTRLIFAGARAGHARQLQARHDALRRLLGAELAHPPLQLQLLLYLFIQPLTAAQPNQVQALTNEGRLVDGDPWLAAAGGIPCVSIQRDAARQTQVMQQGLAPP